MIFWHEGKLSVERALAVNHAILHVICGVSFWLALAAIGRKSLASPVPWLWLFVLILWNEAVDLGVEQWPEPAQQYGEGAKDLVITMLLPTLFMFGARWYRQSRWKNHTQL